jgi:signal transduction histidine kinase
MQQQPFRLNKLHLARTLMAAAILLIVAFQVYWISRLYREERDGLHKETSGIFRDVIYNLQVDRFKEDTMLYRRSAPNLFAYNAVNAMRQRVDEVRSVAMSKLKKDSISGVTVIVGGNKFSDSSVKRHFTFRGSGMPSEVEAMIRERGGVPRPPDTALMRRLGGLGVNVIVRRDPAKVDTANGHQPPILITEVPAPRKVLPKIDTAKLQPKFNVRFDPAHPEKTIIRMISNSKALDDSIPLSRIDSAYKKELAKNNIALAFSLRSGKDDSLHRRDTASAAQFTTRPEFVGFVHPSWYQAQFENPVTFLIKRISPQILFSLFMVAFTSIAFVFLYRNLAAQRRLTEMKNDFISNITHELKTPIATVSVAVEALRNFGGMQDPARTKEYLDISAAELQRLGLLVDKVLKLSLFENRELELKKEEVDLKQLTEEVLNTMKLQFDKHHARVNLELQGLYFNVQADRLHVTSVIYNLLDNAIKYSNDHPDIAVQLRHETDAVLLSVSDKGMGIPAGFRDKIFDKFFRVPTGDHHNIKGYGLGLSYVAHVMKQHGGSISVDSEPGKGSTFTVKFPVA